MGSQFLFILSLLCRTFVPYFPLKFKLIISPFGAILRAPTDMLTIRQICCSIWFNVEIQAYCTLHRITRLAANCYYLYHYCITRTLLMTIPENGYCYSNTFYKIKQQKRFVRSDEDDNSTTTAVIMIHVHLPTSDAGPT